MVRDEGVGPDAKLAAVPVLQHVATVGPGAHERILQKLRGQKRDVVDSADIGRGNVTGTFIHLVLRQVQFLVGVDL